MKTLICLVLAFTIALEPAHSQVPMYINYQGKVAVEGANFTGTGQFRFAIVSKNATTTYWTNGNPTEEVSLPVDKGNFSVLLGNPTIPNMASFQGLDFNGNTELYLRVWFNDGPHGSQLLSPDQQLASAPFAIAAGYVANATPQFQVFRTNGVFTVPPGVTRIMVEVWGGGGGGGGPGAPSAQASGGSGGGGGGGSYGKDEIDGLTAGENLTVLVGGGGSGGSTGIMGNHGGTSTIGEVSAAGGTGGAAGSNAAGSTRGTDGTGGAGGLLVNAPIFIHGGTGLGNFRGAGATSAGGFPSSGGNGGSSIPYFAGAPGTQGQVIVWW